MSVQMGVCFKSIAEESLKSEERQTSYHCTFLQSAHKNAILDGIKTLLVAKDTA